MLLLSVESTVFGGAAHVWLILFLAGLLPSQVRCAVPYALLL